MKKQIWIDGPVKKGILDFINKLLAAGKIKAVLMPAKNKVGDFQAWFLMGKDGLLPSADPIPSVMTMQGANIVAYLTKKGPVLEKTAVILRPCEYRAVIELAKIKQVDLTNLLLISFDCPGAYPLETYFNGDIKKLDAAFEKSLEKQTPLEGARNVCTICHRFAGRGTDIEIGLAGAEGKGFWLIAGSTRGEALLDETDGKEIGIPYKRELVIRERAMDREIERDKTLDAFQETVRGPENLMNVLSACINCHNCGRVCPICFCRECYFDSKALRSDADSMLLRAQRKGGLRLPPDMLLFHLGRMAHMSLSCVSCGACEDACPAGLPVSMLFALAGRDTQAVFQYEPGKRLDEPVPHTVFKFEELMDFETPYTKMYSN